MRSSTSRLATVISAVALAFPLSAMAASATPASTNVRWDSCTSIFANADKDLSNVVLAFADGDRQRFENGNWGKTGTFSGTGANAGEAIVTAWVKSGNNHSGDGPGYGERHDNPLDCGTGTSTGGSSAGGTQDGSAKGKGASTGGGDKDKGKASNGNGKGDHDGDADRDPSTRTTEDNDDDGTPNNVADDGDNAHPSGKDRSVEHDKGNQGKAESDPDDDGRGPDRTNGGRDKPGGKGGVDREDQDGNNGCGNDDDFEDDNEGWCGGKPRRGNNGGGSTGGTTGGNNGGGSTGGTTGGNNGGGSTGGTTGGNTGGNNGTTGGTTAPVTCSTGQVRTTPDADCTDVLGIVITNPDAPLNTATPAVGGFTQGDGTTTPGTQVQGISVANPDSNGSGTPVQAAGGTPTAVSEGALARTGANAIALAIVALLALVGGSAMVRRRHA